MYLWFILKLTHLLISDCTRTWMLLVLCVDECGFRNWVSPTSSLKVSRRLLDGVLVVVSLSNLKRIEGRVMGDLLPLRHSQRTRFLCIQTWTGTVLRHFDSNGKIICMRSYRGYLFIVRNHHRHILRLRRLILWVPSEYKRPVPTISKHSLASNPDVPGLQSRSHWNLNPQNVAMSRTTRSIQIWHGPMPLVYV